MDFVDGGYTPPLFEDEDDVIPRSKPDLEVVVLPVVEIPKRKSRAKPKEPEKAPVLSEEDIAELVLAFHTKDFGLDGKWEYIVEASHDENRNALYVRTAPRDSEGNPIADELHEYLILVRQVF